MSATLINKIKLLSEEFFPEIREVRRHLHKYPELAFKETETAAFIATKLREYGIPFKTGIAKTGIVAIISGKGKGKVIGLRTDMDALEITEQNDTTYTSQNPGIMHACGHDIHMASLLGTAKILNKIKDNFDGTIKLIFQPSEEKYPGGASVMISEGALNNPDVDLMFGQHVLPTLEAGKVGMKSGKYMASTDEIFITIKGKGGHAATPELNIDPILIASRLLITLQEISEKYAPKNTPTVLAFGRFIADGRTNIIPDIVRLEGTLRTYDEEWRGKAHELIRSFAEKITSEMGGSYEVIIDRGYPFLVNDEKTTAETFRLAQEYLGKDNVEELDLRMTAEDFAYYSQLIPSCFYRLGVRNENSGITSNLHTSTFDVDESCIETGMGLMSWIAINNLK